MSIVGPLKVCAMLAVKDRDTAKAFYGGVLALPLVSEDEYGVVYKLNSADLRITPLSDFKPWPHTVLGWIVDDVPTTVKALIAQGIVFERYDYLEQDEFGVWASGNAAVAWFKDPDGNVLSLSND